MNNDKEIIDVELQNWLRDQEDSDSLRAVAGRIDRFAAEETLSPDFVRRVQSRLAGPKRSRGRTAFMRMALAAGFLIAAAGVGFYFGQPRGGAEIAWGDVVTAMQQVERFHITAFGDDSGGPVKMFHVDLYYQRPNHWRAQGMNHLQFGVGPDAKLYSINDGRFVQPGPMVPRLVPPELAAAVEQGDLLNAMVGWLFNSPNPPAGKAVNDPSLRGVGIQVFDYHVQMPGDTSGGLSARIWVIERSRLPIRLEVTDLHSGAKTLAAFDYSEAEPAEFFDGDLFQKKVEAGGPPTTQAVDANHFAVDEVAAWYKTACDWTEPATTLKYSENPADLPAEGKLPEHGGLMGYPVGPADQIKKMNDELLEEIRKNPRDSRKFPPPLPDGVRYIMAVRLNSGSADKIPGAYPEGLPAVFVHQRTSTAGLTRLLVVSTAGFQDSRLSLSIARCGPRGGTYGMLSGTTTSVEMAGICGPGEIRVFAGQPDEKDASRFSIPFEARSKHGFIDGQFEDEENSWNTKLSLRMANP